MKSITYTQNNINDGIYFLVSDSVSGDYTNLFKDYEKALAFYNDDEAGAEGDYDVALSSVMIEDGEITESLIIYCKTVSK